MLAVTPKHLQAMLPQPQAGFSEHFSKWDKIPKPCHEKNTGIFQQCLSFITFSMPRGETPSNVGIYKVAHMNVWTELGVSDLVALGKSLHFTEYVFLVYKNNTPPLIIIC